MKHLEVITNLKSARGLETFCLSYVSTKKIKAKPIHLFFIHDLFDSHSRYLDFKEHLLGQETSFSMSLLDLPGWGLSQSDQSVDMKVLEEACVEFINHVELSPNCDVFLAGQGLGALLVLNLLLKNSQRLNKKISGTILSNPLLKLRAEIQSSPARVSSLRSWLKMGKPLVKGEDLTTDPVKINQFNSTLLNKTSIAPSLLNFVEKLGFELRGQAYFLKIPSLFLLSGADEVADTEFTKLFLKGIDKGIADVREYSRAKHDLLNETNRLDVYETIRKWIK